MITEANGDGSGDAGEKNMRYILRAHAGACVHAMIIQGERHSRAGPSQRGRTCNWVALSERLEVSREAGPLRCDRLGSGQGLRAVAR